MAKTIFLASFGLSALVDVLEDPPSFQQLLYIPTASNMYPSLPGNGPAYEQLADMGFQIDHLDLATASPARTAQAVAASDVIFVGGGNTYYLLDCVNRSGFRDALAQRPDVAYVGLSAGSVIATPDIAYIGEMDDPKEAPDLESTTGLGLVDFELMPHATGDEEQSKGRLAINDEQAVVVRDGKFEIVPSPAL